MNEIWIAVCCGLGGVVFGFFADRLWPQKTTLEQPVEVALRERFVCREDFKELTRDTSAEFRRVYTKIEDNQENVTDQLNSISLMIGRMEGKIDSIKANKEG